VPETVATPLPSRRSTLTLVALLALCLLLTAVCTGFFVMTARARDSARFETLVRMTHDRIAGHLDSDITLLRGAAGFFAASESVSAEEFRIYVERLDLKRHDPGLQGLGFSLRIPAREKEAWVERLRAEGLPSFHIWPEEPREEYHSIIYLEPQDARNQAALGFDMFTNPTRRAAMERAWLTGEPSLSGKVILKQEIDEHRQPGFLLYVPVYRERNVPATLEERREQLEGFVYSPFRAGDLFTGIFPPTSSARVHFRVHDGPEADPERLLYDSAPPGAERLEPPAFTTTSHLEVAGRRWTLLFSSPPAFEQTLLTPWAPGVGALGLLISLMVFAIAWTQVSARQRAEAGEAERTRLLAREQAARAEAEAQRAWLEDLFMQAPALIGILSGPRHVWEFANSAYQRLLSHRALLGKPLHETLPDLSPEILTILDHVYRTGAPEFGMEVSIPLVYASGEPEERYWNFVFQPRRAPQGAVDGVLVFAFEVTEQVRARQQVEASSEEARRSVAQLQSITDTLPALVSYIDTEERYHFVNRTYEEWFGVKPETLLGKTVEEFIGQPRYSHVRAHLHQALSGETVRFDHELPIKDGRVLSVQPHYIPDRDAQGQVRGIVALVLDLTERKRAEEAARNAVRLRDEFLSVASHELKTPLTPLSLKLQTLAREAEAQPDSPFVLKVRAHVEAGRKQIKRLSDLIGDLLDVSRISSGQMKLRPEPVDFSNVVREVVSRLEPEATKVESRLTLELPEVLPGRSDRMRLEQVVENLVTNAIKYGAGKPIHVRLGNSPERVTLTVQDQGIGIAPEHQERIFERFERAVSERNYGGLGLGLYITRTIVEALGGTIRVQSEPGQGAAFTVELPREPAAARQAG
jgi:PAS domain S-box-containing protein